MATHPPWNHEYNQPYLVRSNPLYVTHINRGLSRIKNAKGEYCNVVIDHCIDHKILESRSSIFRVYNLDRQAF